MAGKLKENLNELCRLCATKLNEMTGISIFEGEGDARQLNKKINICLPIKVLKTDNLSQKICEECDYKLELCFAFRKKSILTQSLLINLMETECFATKQNDTNSSMDTVINNRNRQNSSISNNLPAENNLPGNSETILSTPVINITRNELDQIAVNSSSMQSEKEHLIGGYYEKVLMQQNQQSESKSQENLKIKIENEVKLEIVEDINTQFNPEYIKMEACDENPENDSDNGFIYESETLLEDLPSISTDVIDVTREEKNILPEKSRDIYECTYNRFVRWCEERNVKSYTETVLMDYFTSLSTKMKSSTLWARFSMVKATLQIKNGIDIDKFTKLRAFLKKQNDGYVPKKTRIFTKHQIDQFLKNAPDNKYLMMKVVLIIGVAGGCSCDELIHLTIDDIEDVNSALLIKMPPSKTNKARSFMVLGENHLNVYRKYIALRPTTFEQRRLFIKYQSGMCHRVVVGIHKISSVAQEVAKFLNLKNPSEYTGHCLRRTSAAILVYCGGVFGALD